MHRKNSSGHEAAWCWRSFLSGRAAHQLIAVFQAIALGLTVHASGIVASDNDIVAILDANRIASGGDAWNGKSTLEIVFEYAGQGLTGTTKSVIDLKSGAFVESYEIGPIKGANGWDGETAWMKDISGAVTVQAGGDKHALAVNQAYRYTNVWWRKDRGGAAITFTDLKKDGERECTVLRVTPRDGKVFEAWFDNKSHMLARIVEEQGYFLITTNFNDYRSVNGVMIAHQLAVDSGSGPSGLQKLALRAANFREALAKQNFAPPTGALSDFAFKNGLHEATFPFRVLNNHIFADVEINGHGPFNFLFDTGGHDILFPATAAALGLKVEGAAPSGGAGDKTVDFGYAKIDTLEMGDAELSNQIVSVLVTEPREVEGFTVDGLIGFEVFRRFVTRIDYGAQTITLIDPKTFDSRDAGTPVKFEFYDNLPQVHGAFEGIPARFSIDTGSRNEVTLHKPFVEREGLLEKHPKNVLAVDGWGVGGQTRSHMTRGASLRLGDVEIPDVIAGLSTSAKGSFSDANTDGYVGSGLLKRFTVTFDYKNRTMHLKALPKPAPDTAVYDRSGMWINSTSNDFEIVSITPGGPAEKAKLKVGEHIVAVNGNPVKPEQLSNFRMKLRDDPAGTIVHLTIKSPAGEREVALTLRDQI